VAVTGITFVTCGNTSGLSGPIISFFRTAEGSMGVGREPAPAPQNYQAIAHCGETRFTTTEFPLTDNANGNGPVTGRGAHSEAGSIVPDGPFLYVLRSPGANQLRVWRFDPVTGTVQSVTSTISNVSASGLGIAARGFSGYRGFLVHDLAVSRKRILKWHYEVEDGPVFSHDTQWTFEVDEEPENLDVEDISPDEFPPLADDPIFWAAGSAGLITPFVKRCASDGPPAEQTWTIPDSPSGYAYAYVDSINVVGPGEAIGHAANQLSVDDGDAISFFRFLVGETDPFEITDGVTVDGDPYRAWAVANNEHVVTQSGGIRLHVGGDMETVVANTNDGRILLGTLIRDDAPQGWVIGRPL